MGGCRWANSFICVTSFINAPLNVVGTNSMQQMLDKILMELTHLKTLYIFVCPSQKLSLKSNSLEKLCIYKSGNILHTIFFIRLPSEFLPVLGPLTRWCASTLGAAMQCCVAPRRGLIWGLTCKHFSLPTPDLHTIICQEYMFGKSYFWETKGSVAKTQAGG